MVKKLFFSLGLTSLVVSGVMANCGCNPKGCTPGFWKTGNHIAAWENTLPSDSYTGIFGVDVTSMVGDVNGKAYDKLEGMTVDTILELGEALWLKGNDDALKQLVRTSAAALLNIRAGLNYHVSGYGHMDEAELIAAVKNAFAGNIDAGELQSALDDANNEGCPY